MTIERVLLGIALVFPTLAAWLYFRVLSPPTAMEVPADGLARTAYAVCKTAQFALPVIWLIWVARAWPRWPARPARGLAAGVAFGILVGILGWIAFTQFLAHLPLLAETPDRIRAKLLQFGITTRHGFWALAIGLSVAHAFLEEYYWRWFVYGRLREQMPHARANLISALGFMAHHVIVLSIYLPGWFWLGVVPVSLCIFAGGVFWAWLYESSGSLLGPWVSHMIVDFLIMRLGDSLLWPAG